ncbi:hypothetical protein IWW50_000604 [Coemansia erecta]|nr:hypothetical protein GGF43_000720 [Coemansia sp. RSA 2618]KAJ2829876.1 hypothetical protein IWW50_000604 [Coemansia erecta]
MLTLSRNTPHPRSLFLIPTDTDTHTPTYTLRCFSHAGEIDVPAYSSFAAAHTLAWHKEWTSIIVLEGGAHRVEYPRREHQFQAITAQAPPHAMQLDGRGDERIIASDIFTIIRRGLHIEHIPDLETLIIYDRTPHHVATTREIMKLCPRSATYSQRAAERLQIHTVVVCVRDEGTGGVFVRGFWPKRAYEEVAMPVRALACVRNVWDEDGCFEISWMCLGKRCFVVKKSGPGSNAASLIATATTIK